jgi:hypothetical protein
VREGCPTTLFTWRLKDGSVVGSIAFERTVTEEEAAAAAAAEAEDADDEELLLEADKPVAETTG